MINGELIDLATGSYRAQVATSGAGLVHLRRQGRDLVVPFDARTTLPAGWQGKVLLPWPNRVAGSRYTYADCELRLPCNEPETGSALHGLVGWSDFEVLALLDADGQEIDGAPALEARDADEQGKACACQAGTDGHGQDAAADGPTPGGPVAGVLLGLTLPASYGYPWSLQVQVRYQLSAEDGLTVSVRSTNVGAGASPHPQVPGVPQRQGVPAPAPYGVSVHPYLTRGVALDECELSVPAGVVLETDPATMAPAQRRVVAGSEWDWRQGRRVGATSTDNAYTDLPARQWQVRLRGGEGNRTVVMSADVGWVQLYTADALGRPGVAVEPMTCPPNAFGSGEDLVLLEVGCSHTFTYRLHEED